MYALTSPLLEVLKILRFRIEECVSCPTVQDLLNILCILFAYLYHIQLYSMLQSAFFFFLFNTNMGDNWHCLSCKKADTNAHPQGEKERGYRNVKCKEDVKKLHSRSF